MNPANPVSEITKVYTQAKQMNVLLARDVVDIAEIVAALCHLSTQNGEAGKYTDLLKEHLQLDAIVWPEGCLSHCATVNQRAAVKGWPDVSAVRMQLGPALKQTHNNLRRIQDPPEFPDFIRGIFDTPCEATEDFWKINQQKIPEHLKERRTPNFPLRQATIRAEERTEGSEELPDNAVESLRMGDARSQKLLRLLQESVIGQDDALEMLCAGYRRSLWYPRTKGLKGIFTFMGPPGVGKTLLAKSFAPALSQTDQKEYGTLVVSMEGTASEESLFDLFGIHPSYKEARPGRFHEAICGSGKNAGNPCQVIVLDEIEKASSSVIQSFLTVMEEGEFLDKFKDERVDLRQCYLVITTNLGLEPLEARRERDGVQGAQFSSDELFDLLGTAKKRHSVTGNSDGTALSPEFLSRLRQGYAVLFRHLIHRDYCCLLQKEVAALATPATPTFVIDAAASEALLYSFLPNLSPRRLVMECRNLAEKWNMLLLQQIGQEKQQADEFRIPVQASKEVVDWCEKQRQKQSISVWIWDNDKDLHAFLSDLYPGKISLRITGSETELLEGVTKFPSDLVMLDQDIAPLPEGKERGLALVGRLQEEHPSLPILFFGSQSDSPSSDIEGLIKKGEVAGYFPFGRREELQNDDMLKGDFDARFKKMIAGILEEKVMLARERSRLGVRFSHICRLEQGKPSAGAKKSLAEAEGANARNVAFSLLLDSPQEAQVVSLVEDAGGVAPAAIPSVTFDDVYGLERAKARLKEAVLFLREPERLRAFGVKPPSGILLAGPSGTGKTHLARAVANAAKGVFYALSASDLLSKWMGESEEHLRKLFAAARKYAPSVIFIDEIDAVAARRGEASGDGQGIKFLNQLLTCMDGFASHHAPVLVLAATNRPEVLDPAILRPGRFDEIVRIDLPEAKAREQMLRGHLGKQQVQGTPEEWLARLVCRTVRMSPAQIDRILREACYTAAREGRDILHLKDLETATHYVRYGASRPELVLKENEKLRTAWHEAGHALAQIQLFPEDPIDYLTIIPNEEGALGFMAWISDETRKSTSFKHLQKQIQVALAGREAEMMAPESGAEALNTGATSDLARATQLAWLAVTEYGFNADFGCVSLAGLSAEARTRFAGKAPEQVQGILQCCLKEVKTLLVREKGHLERLANELMEKQAMDGEAVAKVLGNGDALSET